MKRFKFKLEPVLKHRMHLEEIKKKEMAVIARELHEAKNLLVSQLDEFGETQVSLAREESIKKLDIEKIMLFESYLIFLKRLMEQQKIKISMIAEKLDKKRQEYIKALKAKKVIERLKEKQYFAYMKEMDDIEQKLINEMGIVKFIHSHKIKEKISH